MPTTHKPEAAVKPRPQCLENIGKELRANAGSNQKNSSDGHPDEKFHLMVQQPAVVQEADQREQRGSRKDADNLLLRRIVPRKQNRSTNPR